MGKLSKPENLVMIKTKLDTEFFRWWCTFLRPLINLTNREIDVISCFLKYRYELSKSITDQAILDTMVMSNDTKKKVMEECKITQEHFYVVMSNLKKQGIIVDDKIVPRLIPNINVDNDTGYIQLLILFKVE